MTQHLPTRTNTGLRLQLRLALPLLGLLLTGCFDAEALINARREVAIRARLEEVDLGKFRLTLPRPIESTEMAEIEFRAFGQVANRDLDRVMEALEMYGPELRHRLLLAARELRLEDVEDPKLNLLRMKIAAVVNETLEGEPLQSVGINGFCYYDF